MLTEFLRKDFVRSTGTMTAGGDFSTATEGGDLSTVTAGGDLSTFSTFSTGVVLAITFLINWERS